MLPLAIGSLVLGGLQAGIGYAQLQKLNKEPRPNFEITPEQMTSFSRAQQRTGYGYSPEQRSDYFQGVAGRYAQNYGNAMKLSGGQLSGAIGRSLQAGQLRDFSSFAAGDAQQQQRNIQYADQIGGQITAKRDMITNQNIQDRIRREQAFGGAVQSGLNNMAGAANFFAMNDGFAQLKGDKGTGLGAQQSFGINPSSPLYNNWQAENQAAMGGVAAPAYSGYGSANTPAFQLPQFNQNFTGLPAPRYGYGGGPLGTQDAVNPYGYGSGTPLAGSLYPFRPR